MHEVKAAITNLVKIASLDYVFLEYARLAPEVLNIERAARSFRAIAQRSFAEAINKSGSADPQE